MRVDVCGCVWRYSEWLVQVPLPCGRSSCPYTHLHVAIWWGTHICIESILMSSKEEKWVVMVVRKKIARNFGVDLGADLISGVMRDLLLRELCTYWTVMICVLNAV